MRDFRDLVRRLYRIDGETSISPTIPRIDCEKFISPSQMRLSSMNFWFADGNDRIVGEFLVFPIFADDTAWIVDEIWLSPTITSIATGSFSSRRRFPESTAKNFFHRRRWDYQQRNLPSVARLQPSHHSFKRIKATPRECSWPTFIFGTETCVYNNTAVTPCTFHRWRESFGL